MGDHAVKQLVKLAVLVLFVFVVVWAGRFASQNLSGITPLIKDSGKDIEELLTEENASPFTLPPGFSISIFAKGLSAPRVLARDIAGNLIVSITKEGRVVALPDRDQNGVADEVISVIEGLNRPHGLAFKCFPMGEFGVEYECKLYIAETDQVAMYDWDDENLKASNKKTIINLPAGRNHFTRTIIFAKTPDGEKLLTSVGSTCNVCFEKDERRAVILSSQADGSGVERFAVGLRNSVFMTIHPETGEVFATEMGRDLLGDNIPPDEINIIRKDKNYGWPTCYGKNIHDTDYDDSVYIRAPCLTPFEEPSYIDIPAHSSPLGLAFTSSEWPALYKNSLFVAYHGSWNRSVPTGYKIVRFDLDDKGGSQAGVPIVEDFITGWFTDDGRVIGRPVDILVEPGGVMYISDDRAGVIYKVTYSGN